MVRELISPLRWPELAQLGPSPAIEGQCSHVQVCGPPRWLGTFPVPVRTVCCSWPLAGRFRPVPALTVSCSCPLAGRFRLLVERRTSGTINGKLLGQLGSAVAQLSQKGHPRRCRASLAATHGMPAASDKGLGTSVEQRPPNCVRQFPFWARREFLIPAGVGFVLLANVMDEPVSA